MAYSDYDIKDFTSAPNYTMAKLRRDQITEINRYVGYLQQMLNDAANAGCTVIKDTINIVVIDPDG